MASPTITAGTWGGYQSLRRFTVDEYHRMIRAGVLEEDDPVELLEGYVVLKMPRNPPHDSTIQRVQKRFFRLLPPQWDVRIQSAVTLADSEPEPDLALVRGDESNYVARHPTPPDIGLIVEVADSSLGRDRTDKARVYARAGIPVYWIVNLIDRRVEVCTGPSGSAASPDYARRADVLVGADVPLILDGVTVAAVSVSDLFP